MLNNNICTHRWRLPKIQTENLNGRTGEIRQELPPDMNVGNGPFWEGFEVPSSRQLKVG